jgi:hypothetical protein
MTAVVIIACDLCTRLIKSGRALLRAETGPARETLDNDARFVHPHYGCGLPPGSHKARTRGLGECDRYPWRQ